PVTNPSCIWYSNPALARNGTLYWTENSYRIPVNEYENNMRWVAATKDNINPWGIFPMGFTGKAAGDANTVHDAYPTASRVALRDGGRGTNEPTGFVTFIATPTSGPFTSYHWTGCLLNGKIFVADLVGNIHTIAGLKLDETKLPFDQYQAIPALDEFVNTT